MTKGISKAETLLKTVLTPLDPPEMIIKNYMILSTSDVADVDTQFNTPQKVAELRDGFIKILDLKVPFCYYFDLPNFLLVYYHCVVAHSFAFQLQSSIESTASI